MTAEDSYEMPLYDTEKVCCWCRKVVDDTNWREHLHTVTSRKIATDPCPDCGRQLIGGDNWSGVKCPDKKCGYWFCF